MSGNAPDRLTPIALDQPITDPQTGKPTPNFGQTIQRILSYLGQPVAGTGSGGSGGPVITISESISNLTTEVNNISAIVSGAPVLGAFSGRIAALEARIRQLLPFTAASPRRAEHPPFLSAAPARAGPVIAMPAPPLPPSGGTGTATAVAGAATLDKAAGIVTSEALVAATTYTLTLTNHLIKVTSIVLVNVTDSTGTAVILSGTPVVTASQVVVTVTMAALTGTVDITFAVFN